MSEYSAQAHSMSVDLDNPGDVLVVQGDSTGWKSIIKSADPVVKFAPYVLESALEGESGWPYCHLTEMRPPEWLVRCNDFRHSGPCWIGWTITMADASQKFVYVIKRYDAETNMWIGVWPD